MLGKEDLARVVNLWRRERKTDSSNPYAELWRHIHPLVIGAVDRANSLSIKLCESLMAHHLKNPAARRRIARALTNGYPAHTYPILFTEARGLGLPVREMDSRIEGILDEL